MRERLTLHLIRHGAPMTTGLLLGHQDMASSAQGEADVLAKAGGLRFDRLITSDLIRCAAPAEKIAALRRLDLVRDKRWRELDFGQWDGCDPAQLDAERLGQFWQDTDQYAPPEGESRHALCERIGAAIGELGAGSALVITHGGAMRAALHHLLGLSHEQCWSIALPYAVRCSLALWRDEENLTGWRGQLEGSEP